MEVYVCIEREWHNGDEILFNIPMTLSQSVWHVNQGSRSIHYGPLTFSLKIKEKYVQVHSIETAIGDSKWQKDADPEKWPSYEIYPESDWNYGLIVDDRIALVENFEILKSEWPSDNFPFTTESVPIALKARGRKLIQWKIDQYGLTGELPIQENRTFEDEEEEIMLIPMGAARLRISAFPIYNVASGK